MPIAVGSRSNALVFLSHSGETKLTRKTEETGIGQDIGDATICEVNGGNFMPPQYAAFIKDVSMFCVASYFELHTTDSVNPCSRVIAQVAPFIAIRSEIARMTRLHGFHVTVLPVNKSSGKFFVKFARKGG